MPALHPRADSAPWVSLGGAAPHPADRPNQSREDGACRSAQHTQDTQDQFVESFYLVL